MWDVWLFNKFFVHPPEWLANALHFDFSLALFAIGSHCSYFSLHSKESSECVRKRRNNSFSCKIKWKYILLWHDFKWNCLKAKHENSIWLKLVSFSLRFESFILLLIFSVERLSFDLLCGLYRLRTLNAFNISYFPSVAVKWNLSTGAEYAFCINCAFRSMFCNLYLLFCALFYALCFAHSILSHFECVFLLLVRFQDHFTCCLFTVFVSFLFFVRLRVLIQLTLCQLLNRNQA